MIDVGRRIGAKDMACRMMTRAACVTNYRKRSITYYSSALFQGRSGSEHCASCIGKQPPPLSKLTPSLIGGMAQGNVSPKMIASVLILLWSCVTFQKFTKLNHALKYFFKTFSSLSSFNPNPNSFPEIFTVPIIVPSFLLLFPPTVPLPLFLRHRPIPRR